MTLPSAPTASTYPDLSNPQTILVTGGAGFIGSWLVRHLLSVRPDCHVVNLDALTYAGNLENLASVENLDRYHFIHGDITDPSVVEAAFKQTGATVCINAAAQTHVDRSIDDPAIFVQTNVLGTQVLLEAARRHGIKKFIQISTDEVYGSLPLDAPSQKFTETSPLAPSSPYSASKTGADLLALSYHATYGLPVCITRCSNDYGPNQYPEKLIPLFILNAFASKPVPVYGDGLNVRDWIHVEDHSRAVVAVLAHGLPGEIYNIGGLNEQNNLAITRQILALCHRDEALIRYVTDRPGHDRRYAIDCRKIMTELNWRPTIAFSTGLAKTVEWYRNHPAWIENILRRQAALTLT